MPLNEGHVYRTPDGKRFRLAPPTPGGSPSVRVLLTEPVPAASGRIVDFVYELPLSALSVREDGQLFRMARPQSECEPLPPTDSPRWATEELPDALTQPLRVMHLDTGWTVADLQDLGPAERLA